MTAPCTCNSTDGTHGAGCAVFVEYMSGTEWTEEEIARMTQRKPSTHGAECAVRQTVVDEPLVFAYPPQELAVSAPHCTCLGSGNAVQGGWDLGAVSHADDCDLARPIPKDTKCFTCKILDADHRDGAGYPRCEECR